jgi:ribonuclease HI
MNVWTDGATSGAPGIGGWAWISDTGRRGFGSHPSTTNQRMELQAALDVVQHVPGDLVVHSDSAYVVNCFLQGWWKGWRKSNYKNGSIKNLDLWVPLIDGVVGRTSGTVSFVKVKGHSGNVMNDKADALCVAAKHQQLPTTRIRSVRRAARSSS